MITLRENDGFELGRVQATEALSALIEKRIYDLQNPEDCATAKKLVCTLNKGSNCSNILFLYFQIYFILLCLGCGFGCQIHHVAYCFIVAYATSRTMILESKGWRYNRQGWEKVFLPVSDTCTTPNGASRGDWTGNSTCVA